MKNNLSFDLTEGCKSSEWKNPADQRFRRHAFGIVGRFNDAGFGESGVVRSQRGWRRARGPYQRGPGAVFRVRGWGHGARLQARRQGPSRAIA